MDSILEVIGVKTKQYVMPVATDLFEQRSVLHRVASSSATGLSPDEDDEIEMGVEAELCSSADISQ